MPTNLSTSLASQIIDEAQPQLESFRYAPTGISLEQTTAEINNPQSFVSQARQQRLQLRKILDGLTQVRDQAINNPTSFGTMASSLGESASNLLERRSSIQGLKRDGMLYLAADFNHLRTTDLQQANTPRGQLNILRLMMINHRSLMSHIQNNHTNRNERDNDRHFREVEENINLRNQFQPVYDQQNQFLRTRFGSPANLRPLIGDLQAQETELRNLEVPQPNNPTHHRTIEFNKRKEMLLQSLNDFAELGINLGTSAPRRETIEQITPNTLPQ